MAERFYINDLAKEIDRTPHTIRCWERYGNLPVHLIPERDERDWRYWTQDQVQAISDWIVETDRRPGKSLEHYQPTKEETAAHIKKTRRKRKV